MSVKKTQRLETISKLRVALIVHCSKVQCNVIINFVRINKDLISMNLRLKVRCTDYLTDRTLFTLKTAILVGCYAKQN